MQFFRLFSLSVFSLFLLSLNGCGGTSGMSGNSRSGQTKEIKGVILLIGDGMGLAQVSTRYYYGDGEPQFSRFPYTGLINTSSSAEKVTDSASGATAFSTGVRTYNAAIGVDPDTVALPTIVETVSKMGWSTGLVATSSIVHATPASFFAHVPYRDMYEEIASQLVHSDVDFFAGGGTKFFFQREDGQDLHKPLADNGFVVDTLGLDVKAKYDINKKYGFLLAEDGMPTMRDDRGPFLQDATTAAIDYLSQNQQGFFLMVEGSQIDWGGHANNFSYLVTEVLDFDKTLGLVMDYAEKEGDILVVVTADHETGGLSLSAAENTDYQEIGATFSTGGHSATLIPVFAYGPGAETFTGVYNNTDIYHKIAKLIKLK